MAAIKLRTGDVSDVDPGLPLVVDQQPYFAHRASVIGCTASAPVGGAIDDAILDIRLRPPQFCTLVSHFE